MDWAQITSILTGYGQVAWGYFSSPTVLFQLGVIGALFLLAVWDAFKENGIRIPDPNREITMRSFA